MKDRLVSLFLSVVGRAPFDGVKERWTFWSLSKIKAVNFRRWCFDERTHSAKLWKTLVTRSFPKTIRTPLERIYLQFHNVIDWNEFLLLIILTTLWLKWISSLDYFENSLRGFFWVGFVPAVRCDVRDSERHREPRLEIKIMMIMMTMEPARYTWRSIFVTSHLHDGTIAWLIYMTTQKHDLQVHDN